MLLKELKKALLTISFLLVAVVFLAGYTTQLDDYLSPGEKIVPPEKGLASYGAAPSDDPEIVMPAALQSLYAEFTEDGYTTYPLGFVRYVRLGEKDQEKMAEILAKMTDLTIEELKARMGSRAYREGEVTMTVDDDGALSVLEAPKTEENSVRLKAGITYETFCAAMKEADELLGGGSDYAPEFLSGFGTRPKTYEEAMDEYKSAEKIDRFTGAHARLFADYMTIFAALLPAFFIIAEALRDRRAKLRDLLWVRKCSSLSFTLCRFGAVVLLSMLPVLLLAGVDSIRAAQLYAGEAVDLFAYLKYSFGWVLPTVLFSAALGLLCTEATDTPIGLLVMLLFWLFDVNRSGRSLTGSYGDLLLIPRHNNLLGADQFAAGFSTLAANRIFYTVLAFVLLGASALILEQKRAGRWFALPFHRKGAAE